MPESDPAFNGETAEKFADHAETVRGLVRYELVRRNLGELTARPAFEVADIGGGSAIDAIWLAELGHHVTVVEPAADQIAKGRGRVSKQPQAVAERIEFVKGTAQTLLDSGKKDSYDLVLSHGVAMYLPEPEHFVGELVRLTKTGGYISLLEKSYYGAEATRVREGKFAEALELAETGQFVNHMGKKVWAFLPEELEEMLSDSGAKVRDWSGVRVSRDADCRQTSEVEPAELQKIVDAEFVAGHRPDTRGGGQMLHFIAQRLVPKLEDY